MYGGWPKYVPVAVRKDRAKKKVAEMRRNGKDVQPIEISGRLIARSFWGKAWCAHLEQFSDYENRLPRGRTYVRNGSVCHLAINKGEIRAIVSGSELYNINIQIKPLPKARWEALKKLCAGGIGSMLELLQGKLSDNVMAAVTDTTEGLFPAPSEIALNCDCPDWADLCKHLAAVLYGVGARLDESPELLFLLRGVDHRDLIDVEVELPQVSEATAPVTDSLSELFGIDLDETLGPLPAEPAASAPAAKERAPKSPKKAAAKAKAKRQPSRARAGSQQPAPRLTVTESNSADLTAERLLTFREHHTLTQQDFARLVSKSLGTVQRWEACEGVIKLQRGSRAALDELLGQGKGEIGRRLRRLS